MQYQAVIFDLDGTLLDTLNDLGEAMNKALLLNNLPTHEMFKYKYFVGEGLSVLAEKAVFPIIDKKVIENVIKSMREIYAENCYNNTQPYPGINDLLKHLSAKNIKLAVLSNKQDDLTKLLVKHYFSEFYFSQVLGSRINIPKKPDPYAALEIAKDLLVKPENIIYVGDTNIDMQTSSAAKMFSVGVTWGFRPAKELVESGAKELINQPLDLVKLLV